MTVHNLLEFNNVLNDHVEILESNFWCKIRATAFTFVADPTHSFLLFLALNLASTSILSS